MTRTSRILAIFSSLLLGLGSMGCSTSNGGGQTKFEPPRTVNPSDVQVPAGYRVEVVAEHLNFPTGVAFDDKGQPFVIEAGYSYGEAWDTPRLLRIEPGGQATQIATGDGAPWT